MATVTYFTDRSQAHGGLVGQVNYTRALIDLSKYPYIASNDVVQAVNMAAGQIVTGIWVRVVSGCASATSFTVGDGNTSTGFMSCIYLGSAYSGYVYYRAVPFNYSMLSNPVLSTDESHPSYFRGESKMKIYSTADTIDLFFQCGATDGTAEVIVQYLQTSDTQ